ncbi:hypothetical protein [Acinetobacter sp. WCHAc010052]|uniref:hypothetical protein n=1 Tax=Acinetobacter sp. WCHAc010052 TaxID=2004647 RepID=UPI000B3C7AD0|nr:hypothetical protein [Acinetobacter sp. WCHAc010052]AXY59799.1 hypothetical protein CDG61_07015 [Acinetobacter sp. WCHAc010052]
MLKMIDVFGPRLVQHFSSSVSTQPEQFTELLTQSINNAEDADLHKAVSHFFNRQDAVSIADALDINPERVQTLLSATSLKDEMYLEDTTRIITLCLALETDVLHQLEVSDLLEDYPV